MSKAMQEPGFTWSMMPSVKRFQWAWALGQAKHLYFIWHQQAHWLLVRLARDTKLLEIFEVSCLVRDDEIGRLILRGMNALLPGEFTGWRIVLYRKEKED